MEKFAVVQFIGNSNDYICGKNCDTYTYCRDCEEKNECKKEKRFHFIKGERYKAFFLDFCQGVRDVLEIEDANGEKLDFVPLEDFQVIDDKYDILQDKRAFVKCIAKRPDLTLGEKYIALRLDENNNSYYVLDNSKDCYYYDKKLFIVVEDKHMILTKQRIKLYFSPEYSTISLCDEEGAYFTTYEDFPLSQELIKELKEFDESIWEFLPDSNATQERLEEIYENGLRLYRRVVEELGDGYEVIEALEWINPNKGSI